MRMFVYVCLASTAVFLVACGAWASTVVDVELGDTANASAWIGHVEIQAGRDFGDGRTTYLAHIKEVYKGDLHAGQRIVFQIPGGLRGERRLVVMGMENFSVGEEAIIFLAESPRVLLGEFSDLTSAQRHPPLQDWRAYQVKRGRQVVRKGSFTRARMAGGRYALSHDSRVSVSKEDFLTDLYRSLD